MQFCCQVFDPRLCDSLIVLVTEFDCVGMSARFENNVNPHDSNFCRRIWSSRRDYQNAAWFLPRNQARGSGYHQGNP
jgi:hypothetical protein